MKKKVKVETQSELRDVSTAEGKLFAARMEPKYKQASKDLIDKAVGPYILICEVAEKKGRRTVHRYVSQLMGQGTIKDYLSLVNEMDELKYRFLDDLLQRDYLVKDAAGMKDALASMSMQNLTNWLAGEGKQ